MFSGIQEILLLLVIVVALIMLPRILERGRRSSPSPASLSKGRLPLTGRMRLAIFASVIWLLGSAVYFQPWRNDLATFFYYGLLPVALIWGLIWVVAGFRSRRR